MRTRVFSLVGARSAPRDTGNQQRGVTEISSGVAPWLVTGIALLLAAGPVTAHHAFNSEFDANKPVKVRGTVSKVEWINPHAWIHMDVKKADGTVERWMFEAGTPNTLMRRGLTKNSLAIGTEIVADGYQSKDGICEPACRANGRDLTLPDGTTLFLGNDGGRGQ